MTILYHPRDPLHDQAIDNSWWEEIDSSFIALPFFPYLSNCREYDSHIPIFKILEVHPSPWCSHQSASEVVPIFPYLPWKRDAPTADECKLLDTEKETFYDDHCKNQEQCITFNNDPGMLLSCQFEENIFTATAIERWYEVAEGTVLYYLTRFPVSHKDFIGEQEKNPAATGVTDARWGVGSAIGALLDTDALIPVTVPVDHGSKVGLVPRLVQLRLEYYQRSSTDKSIVSAELWFEDFCSMSQFDSSLQEFEGEPIEPCQKKVYDFSFSFRWRALSWMELLNAFEFGADLYTIIFSIIAGAVSFIGFVIYLAARSLTILSKPPRLKLVIWMRIVSKPSVVGVVLASSPFLLLLCAIHFWFMHGPAEVSLQAYSGTWTNFIILTPEDQKRYQFGRIGAVVFFCSFFMLRKSSRLLIPETFDSKRADDVRLSSDLQESEIGDDDSEKEGGTSEYWAPKHWKRMHVQLWSCCVASLVLFIWEFSYAPVFEDIIFYFVVLYKVLQLFSEALLSGVLKDMLIQSPIHVFIEITFMLVTLGASDFLDFLFSFVVELQIMLVERLIVGPMIKHLLLLIPRWRLHLRKRFVNRKHQTLDQRKLLKEELAKAEERLALETTGMEPVIECYAGYTTELTAVLMFPFLLVLLIVYSKATSIPANYGILEKDLTFYLIFAVVMIPATLVMDVFILNSIELVHRWKVFDYVSYQQYRFGVRKKEWQMSNTVLDVSISPCCQTIDNLCFSSQYFFLTAFHCWGMMCFSLGIVIQTKYEYAWFSDPWAPILFIASGVICAVGFSFLEFLKRRLKIWHIFVPGGAIDKEMAKKLRVGKGRDKKAEAEAFELRILNDEGFKQRFVEKNQPWILQHLVEVFTPRTLDEPRKNNQLNIDYVKDVYGTLQGELQDEPVPSNSDDSEDEDTRYRQWSKEPLLAVHRELLTLWLEKAKRRRLYFSLIRDQVEQRTKSSCGLCSRTLQSNGVTSLKAMVAKDGAGVSQALDFTIAAFDEHYQQKAPPRSQMNQLWKAYFRTNGSVVTMCNLCTSRSLVVNTSTSVQSAPVATAADDISTDSEPTDGLIRFPPLVISVEGVEGKALSKWLDFARHRLGGTFPREEAIIQSRQYAEKLRASVKQKHAEKQEEVKVELNLIGRSILLSWLEKAATSKLEEADLDIATLLADLEQVRNDITTDVEWQFSTAFLDEGAEIAEEGDLLQKERQKAKRLQSSRIAKWKAELDKVGEGLRLTFEESQSEVEVLLQKASRAFEEKKEKRLAVLASERQVFLEEHRTKLNLIVSGVDRNKAISEHNALLHSIDQQMKTLVETGAETVREQLAEDLDQLKQLRESTAATFSTKREKYDRSKLAAIRENLETCLAKKATWTAKTIKWTDKVRAMLKQTRANEL